MVKPNFKKTNIKVKKPGMISKFKNINWQYVGRWLKSGTKRGAMLLADEFKTKKDPQILQVLWHNGHKQMVFSLFNGMHTGEYDKSLHEAAKSQLRAKPMAKQARTAREAWEQDKGDAPEQISRPKNIMDDETLNAEFRKMFNMNL